MSQIYFNSKLKDGRDVEVMTGWDRPLQHFFVTLFDPFAGEDDEEVIWSSMDDPEAALGGGYADITDTLSKIRAAGVESIPERLANILAEHRRIDAGNMCVRLFRDGADYVREEE